MSTDDDAWKPWPKCPADGCQETEDVTIMECIPGYTYMVIGGICGDVVMLARNDVPLADEDRDLLIDYFRPTDVPRETKED